MAQNPWDNDPIVTPARSRSDARANEREQAETRYRNATQDQNPLARPVILPGEEGYAGDGKYLPAAGVVVRGQAPWESDPVVTDSQLNAGARAAEIVGTDATDDRENALYQGVTLGFADEIGGNLAGWGQQLRNIGRSLNGQPIDIRGADLRDAVIEQTRGRNADFRETNPLQSGAFELAGGLLTGGGSIGTGIRGLTMTGAAYGAGYGLGAGEGGIIDRAPGAAVGAVAGGVGGAVLGVAAPYAQRLGSIASGIVPQPVREFAGRLGGRRPTPDVVAARRLSNVITPESYAERTRLQGLGLNPSVLDTLDNTGERMIRSAAGPAGPGAEAAVRYSRNRAADLKPEIMGVTRNLTGDPRSATAIREGLESQRSTLADEQYAPAYAERVAVDEQTLRALSDEPGRAALRRARSAAVARQNDAQVAEIDSLIDRIEAQNSGFNTSRPYYHGGAPGITEFDPTRTVRGNYGQGIYTTRNQSRAAEYAGQNGEVYPLWLRQERVLDLTTPEGRAWYDANRGTNMGETYDVIRAPGETVILNPEAARRAGSAEVSAGTLDRVRIAMAGRAQAMQQRPDTRDIASGLFGRAGQIDQTLEAVPGLAPARATYRDLSGAIEQIDNASGILTTDPADFARQVQGMTPTQREAAIVGLRQEILDTLGGQRIAGTGSLQNLSESTYARQNLETLLGPEEAANYIGRIEASVQQAQRAARVSPNTNSQTFGRGVDDETFNAANMIGATVDVGQSMTGNVMAIGRTIDRIASRATLSPQERAAIVELGIGSADDLERIVRVAQESRQRNRPPPREVRAWIVNAQNVLGPRNPILLELERVLLPTRVAAEQNRQGQGR